MRTLVGLDVPIPSPGRTTTRNLNKNQVIVCWTERTGAYIRFDRHNGDMLERGARMPRKRGVWTFGMLISGLSMFGAFGPKHPNDIDRSRPIRIW